MATEIIAELAQGFEGRPEQARLLLLAAAAAGADAAKYQLVYADELATPDYKHHALYKTLEMPDEAWMGLGRIAAEKGVALHLDIFGSRSLELAERSDARAVKLHPTDIVNIGLIEAVARSRVPRVLLGAGGAHVCELDRALELLRGKQVVVLLGFQTYPTPTASNQIDRIRVLVNRLQRGHPEAVVGFADHAEPDSRLSYALAACAIGAGARVIEKHLTLGTIMKLEDHESALNPDEFAGFVRVMRDCDAAVGRASDANDFGMSESEQGYRRAIRRHVVSRRPLAAATVLGPADLTLKRTSAEQPLTDLAAVYGRRLKHAVPVDSPLTEGDLA